MATYTFLRVNINGKKNRQLLPTHGRYFTQVYANDQTMHLHSIISSLDHSSIPIGQDVFIIWFSGDFDQT